MCNNDSLGGAPSQGANHHNSGVVGERVIDIVGWCGMAIILLAYALVSSGIGVTANSVTYQAMNIAGSLGLICVAVVRRAHQVTALNVAWVVIGVVALVRMG